MNAWLTWESGGWWHVAGWTMLHFLWLGALVGLAAGVCRLVLRRASANVRYVAAVVCLVLLAGLPVGIGVWVGAKPYAVGMAENPVNVPLAEIAPAAPGSAGGEIGIEPVKSPINNVSAHGSETLVIQNTDSNARETRKQGAPRGLNEIFARVAEYLPWSWIIGTPLTFVLLATGVVGAERLRRTSCVIDHGPIAEACARLVEALGIGRRVTIAVCERIAAPVLVGIVRPIILLPPAALTGWSPDEIEMVLLHELAHVRRCDNLINLVQRMIESLLFFHPAVWLVSNWVRSEREACCDAVVVGRTNRPHAYAEMLVALAAQMPRSVLLHPAATSAMAAGPLRGRIHRILGLQDDPMLVSGKSLGVVMGGLLVVATVLVLNLPQQSTAEERAQQADDQIDKDAEKRQAIAQVEATNQLKYLALALYTYHDAKGTLPAHASYDGLNRPLLSWRVHILPYLDGNAAGGGSAAELYKEFHLDEPWDSEHNRKLIPRIPPVFRNSNSARDKVSGFTNLLAVVGDDCVFDGSARGIKLSDVSDGTSNTVMVVEADQAVEWTKPDDLHFNPAMPKVGLGGQHPNGWLAAFADGSVSMVNKDEPDEKVREMFTRGRQAKESAAADTESPTQPSVDTVRETLDAAAAELDKAADELDAAADELIADKLQSGPTVLQEVLLREMEDLQRAKRQSEARLKKVQAESVVVIRELKSELARFDTNVTTSQLQQAKKESQIRMSVWQQQIAEFNERLEEKAEELLRTSEFPGNLWLTDVPFVVGASRFKDGDAITITEVRGTAKTFKPGHIYWIKGTYTLGSRERATLAAYTTVKDPAYGTSASLSIQSTDVDRGEDTFTLVLPMTYRGWPHVSFYPVDGGEGFGGVYFGTGDSVLKQWWGPGEVVDTTAAVGKDRTTKSPEKARRLDRDEGKDRAATQNNLKNLLLALLTFNDAKQTFPAVANFDANGKPLLSWRVHLLPYLGEEALYREFHLDETWNSEHNRKLVAEMPKVFKNPRIDRPGFTNYLAVVGSECMFDGTANGIRLSQVRDGTANTLALVEADADQAVEWTKPQDWEFDRAHPTAGLGGLWSDHWFGFRVDGSSCRVSNHDSPDKVGIQFTRAGGETKSLSESAGQRGINGGELGIGGAKPAPKPVDEFRSKFIPSDTNRYETRVYEITDAPNTKLGLDWIVKMLKRDPSEPKPVIGYNWTNDWTRLEIIAPTEGQETVRQWILAAQSPATRTLVGGQSQPKNAQSASEDWPNGVAFPSPMEGEISRRAWQELGIKVVPATKSEATSLGGRPIKVVDGVPMPPGTPEARGPMFLVSVGENEAKDFDDLATALQKVKDKEMKMVKCVVTDQQGLQHWILVAAGPPSTPGTTELLDSTQSHKFPSLEEQKLADLAWKRLGLELAPIGEEDLKRVRALGYDGGLRVTGRTDRVIGQPLETGNILVGLHVWPMTSLRDVATVLHRDDLAELSPLKYYIVLPDGDARTMKGPLPDKIETGRIPVSLDKPAVTLPGRAAAESSERPRVVAAARNPVPVGAAELSSALRPVDKRVDQQLADNPKMTILDKQLMRLKYMLAERDRLDTVKGTSSIDEDKAKLELTAHILSLEHLIDEQRQQAFGQRDLRYDGKTFDEWRNAWKTELSTERRLEAVRALAAFGANGYGKEAAEAIVEVAGQYDWTSIGLSSTVDALRLACLGALGSSTGSETPHYLPEVDVLPAILAAAANSKNTQSRLFATYVLPTFAGENPAAADALLKLSSDADARVRSYAFQSIGNNERTAEGGGITSRLVEKLTSNDPETVRTAIRSLVKDKESLGGGGMVDKHPALTFTPFLLPQLFAPDVSVRKEARQAIRFAQGSAVSDIVGTLLTLLNDDARRANHLEAIRALAALGPKAAPAMDKLKQLLSSDDAQIRIAAAAAIKMIVGKDQYQKPVADVLGKELGIDVVESNGGWSALPRVDAKDGGKAFNEFTEAVITEQGQLFPDGKF